MFTLNAHLEWTSIGCFIYFFSQSEHIIGPGSHVKYPTGTKNRNFVEDHPRNIPAKFGSNWPSGFGEEAWNVKSLQTTDRMCIGWSSTILRFLFRYEIQNGENTEIYSSLKLLHWLNLNCASIIGRNEDKGLFFIRWSVIQRCSGSLL
jgi:hypothetical protein